VALLRHLTSATLALLLAAVLVGQACANAGAGSGAGPGAGPGLEQRLELVSSTRAERIKDALGTAQRQKGDRYKYGAEGPNRFDCSGLVYFATHKAGFDHVPRTSAEQGRYMRHIKKKNLRRGDFVFFTGSSGVYHVGIYVGRRDGDRAILHAPKPHTRVRVETVWTDSWFAGTLRK
jgi:cell wall-associated NlpC family hydrolase